MACEEEMATQTVRRCRNGRFALWNGLTRGNGFTRVKGICTVLLILASVTNVTPAEDTNLALHAPVFLSSVNSNKNGNGNGNKNGNGNQNRNGNGNGNGNRNGNSHGLANNAVDGIFPNSDSEKEVNLTGCFQTPLSHRPYLRVDLGTKSAVNSVRIFGIPEHLGGSLGVYSLLDGVEVWVGDVLALGVRKPNRRCGERSYTYREDGLFYPLEIKCSNLEGRYVWVKMRTSRIFTVCEVEVMGGRKAVSPVLEEDQPPRRLIGEAYEYSHSEDEYSLLFPKVEPDYDADEQT